MKQLNLFVLSLLLMNTSCSLVNDCSFEITGVVVDWQTRQPIEGAKVFAEGSKIAKVTGAGSFYPSDTIRTDANGKFTMTLENKADEWRLLVGGKNYLYDEQYVTIDGCSDYEHSVAIEPLAKVTLKGIDDPNVTYDSVRILSVSNRFSFWDMMEGTDSATLTLGEDKTIYIPGESQGKLMLYFYSGETVISKEIIHDAQRPGDEIELEIGL